MIRIDQRTGSGELERYFAPFGIKVLKTHLDYGDFDFIGRGPRGECAVVVERKRVEDLIQSIQSKRLSGHQLPGMAKEYDYCYLIVEGIWRPGEDGELEIRNGNWSVGHGKAVHYRSVDNYLATLELQAGVIYRRTASPRETVFTIVDLFHWWTDKDWAAHKAHEAVYAPAEGGEGRRLRLVPRQVGLVEKVALQIPMIGDKKARDVAKKFKTVRQLVAAEEETWRKIPGIGKTGAKTIVEALRGKT